MTSEQKFDVGHLVAQVRAGDKQAYAALVRRFENAAYAAALSRLPGVEDAQDVVQDAFVEAYCKLNQLREPERFGWWLRRIVHNRALNRLREGHGVAWTDQTSAQMAIRSVAETELRGKNRELWEAVHALPEEYRECVLMFYLNRFSYREIAAILGLSVATVNTRLNKARGQLRQYLSPAHEEEWNMGKTDVEEAVQKSIYQIAREEIHHTFSAADTQHVVLFCGVRADVEICHTDGDEVLVTGAKTAIGLSEEEGQACLRATEVRVDQVDNFLRTGPHAGEVSVGANSDSAQNPPRFELQVRPSHQWLDRLTERPDRFSPIDDKETATGIYRTWAADELYAEIAPRGEGILKRIRWDLAKPVTRLSVVQQEAQGIRLSEEEFSESVRRVFRPVSEISDHWFGANGYVDLVVALPPGVDITVLRADAVDVSELRSNINVVDGHNLTLSRIRGDVHLLDSSVKRAQDIEGNFAQSLAAFTGCELLGNVNMEIRRSGICETELKNLVGEIRLDVLQVNLEAVGLHGDVKIRNRFGRTHFRLSEDREDSRYQLEADSGDIRISVKESLVEKLPLTLHTLCGHLDANAVWEQVPHRSTNAGNPVISLTARATPGQPSRLLAHTRDGKIVVEMEP